MHNIDSARSGFSLVELSIVLVILGLLTGGILAGQSLIRAAEMRSVVSDYQRYIAATQSFRDKYLALPGDMNNATRFWQRQVNDATCVTNSSAAVVATGVCDGNGDGAVWVGTAVSVSAEAFQFWRQLAAAGLVEGTYSGLAGPATPAAGQDHVFGVNSPVGKMSNSGWGVSGLGVWGGDPVNYGMDYGNAIFFGARNVGFMAAYGMRAEEVWNIDTKLDDGKPARGKVTTQNWDVCTTSATQTDLNGEYVLTDTTLSCSPAFIKAF